MSTLWYHWSCGESEYLGFWASVMSAEPSCLPRHTEREITPTWGSNSQKGKHIYNARSLTKWDCLSPLVAQSCLTLCDSMGYHPPGSSVHGILQVSILEWVAIPFFRVSSQPRYQIWLSCIAGIFFHTWATREAYCSQKYKVSYDLVFQTWESYWIKYLSQYLIIKQSLWAKISWYSRHYFLSIYFLIRGKLLYNVLVSAIKHHESVIIIHIPPPPEPPTPPPIPSL